MDFEIDEEDVQECLDLMAIGEKVKAIKHARGASGAGLKEAKEWVEDGCPDGTTTTLSVTWKVRKQVETVQDLVNQLFDLSREISEVHRRLEKMGVSRDKST